MSDVPRQPLDLQLTQKLRKVAALVAGLGLVGLALVTQSYGGVDGAWHEIMEGTGLAAIALAIVGRAWCSLYIGGRKKREIVSTGPYSVTRNPLYLFSLIGAFGVGAQAGSLTMSVLFALAAAAVFRLTVAREEAWLCRSFGATYLDYLAKTPRFLPNFSLWRDDDELTVRPVFFLLTLRDGLAFLFAIPLFELIDVAQSGHWLRIIAHLP